MSEEREEKTSKHKYSSVVLLIIGGIIILTSIASSIDGFGTKNYLSKFSNSETLINSQILDDGENISINGVTSMDLNVSKFRLLDSSFDDIAIGGNTLGSGAFAPAITSWNGTGAFYCYAGTVRNEYSYGSAELPHNWKEGTTLYPHIHSSKSTTGAGNYVFKLDWSISNSTSITYGTTNVTVTNGGQWYHYINSFDNNITGTNFKISDIFAFTITRVQDHSLDTYADCVGISQVSLHYEIDSFGSDTMVNK